MARSEIARKFKKCHMSGQGGTRRITDLARDVFILCIQTKFQLELFRRLGDAFLGIDATHNVTQYKGILLFTIMARDHWGHGARFPDY